MHDAGRDRMQKDLCILGTQKTVYTSRSALSAKTGSNSLGLWTSIFRSPTLRCQRLIMEISKIRNITFLDYSFQNQNTIFPSTIPFILFSSASWETQKIGGERLLKGWAQLPPSDIEAKEHLTLRKVKAVHFSSSVPSGDSMSPTKQAFQISRMKSWDGICY